jgi:hypothetical protein
VHTPDFMVVTRSGTWLVDVRPEPLIGETDRQSFAAASPGTTALPVPLTAKFAALY